MTPRLSSLLCAFLLVTLTAVADTVDGTLTADGNSAQTYQLIRSRGYDLEPPDESGSHATSPFQHIQQQYDATLKKQVFAFYIHALIDDDRGLATVTDRQRNEIKTGPKSPASLIAQEDETMTMRWKFKLPIGMKTTTKFSHIHQLKGMDNSAGTADVSLPIITLTCYTHSNGSKQVLRLLYNDRSTQTSSSATRLQEVDLNSFLGEWVEAVETVTFGNHGKYSITLRRLSDNKQLLSYSNSDMYLWCSGTTGLRPKWGIYRYIGENRAWQDQLRDEVLLFADFSIKKGTPSGICQAEQSSHNAGCDYYTLSGQCVEHPSKGLYITNGRLTIVK